MNIISFYCRILENYMLATSVLKTTAQGIEAAGKGIEAAGTIVKTTADLTKNVGDNASKLNTCLLYTSDAADE